MTLNMPSTDSCRGADRFRNLPIKLLSLLTAVVGLIHLGCSGNQTLCGGYVARTTEFKQLVLQKAKDEAQCGRNAITRTNHGSYFILPATSVVTDVTSEPNLYAVGQSSFFRTAFVSSIQIVLADVFVLAARWASI